MTILSTAPVIDAAGIRAPSYGEVLQYFKDQYRNIYGADTYLEADSQDGQLLAVFAMAIHDANTAAVQVYNAFSPATASGAALSSNVKINGLARGVATRSSVDLRIVGQGGTTISGGVALDGDRVQWELPASVTIPPAGEITVTALCRKVGAVAAAPAPSRASARPRWAGVRDQPGRRQRARRKRRGAAGPASRVGGAAVAHRAGRHGRCVASVPGVLRHVAYENDTAVADANGLPPHSIALVVDGGDAGLIASAIAAKKTPGTGTHGSTSVVVTDIYGIAHPIRFFRPIRVPVSAEIQMRALAGYHGHGPGGAAGGGGLHQWRGHRRRRQRVRGMGRRHLGSQWRAGQWHLQDHRPGAAPVIRQRAPDVALAFNEAASTTPDAVKITVSG